jgi:hypothetical protein
MTHPAKLLPVPTSEPETSSRTGPRSFVVECLAATHATLTGRVEVRFTDQGIERVRWLATLRGLSIRAGDRLLAVTPCNWDDAIVVGVVDGFGRRPPPEKEHAATLDLLPDEAVCIRSAGGKPLLELTAGERGAEIRLLEPDAALEVDGHLAIGAKRITLTAREGETRIEASDDVVVRGENVHLN